MSNNIQLKNEEMKIKNVDKILRDSQGINLNKLENLEVHECSLVFENDENLDGGFDGELVMNKNVNKKKISKHSVSNISMSRYVNTWENNSWIFFDHITKF